MVSRLLLVSSTVLLFGGCHMMSSDGHSCTMCGSQGGVTSGACSSDKDCGSGEKCNAEKTCVPTNQPAPCKDDVQCAQGAYCDAIQGRCVASAACTTEVDCAEGFNCDSARSTCAPSAAPTCGELDAEAECLQRSDCAPVYAGVGCSCGADCTCKGGEPGCVCESFEFFRCAQAP